MHRIVSLLLIFAAIAAKGRQVSQAEALSIASEFFNSGSAEINQAPLRAADAAAWDANEPRPYYIFNAPDEGGFVIVSGDTRSKKILGYADAGAVDISNMPPQLSALLEKYAEHVDAMPLTQSQDASWQASAHRSALERVDLKTANWGQNYPYNMYAQVVDGVRCPTGCVATAMAIVMKYHNFPEKGRGMHAYMSNGEKIDFDFGAARFDYPLLLDKYVEGQYSQAQAQAVGLLMKAAGAAVNMQYYPYGSGALPSVVGHYMHEYFHFSPDCQYIQASHFSESDWWNKIKGQIDRHLPVIYSGYGDMGGHTFVCDGYDSERNLHINWGWDGISNGYYSLEAMGGFSSTQGMVLNIEPSDDDTAYSRCWNDYGYLWASAGQSVGVNISVDDIEANEDFSVVAGMVTFPSDFDGLLGFALTDAGNEIVELAKDQSGEIAGAHFESCHDWDNIGYSWIGHGNLPIRNIHFSNQVLPEYRLAIVSKEDNDDAWRLVLGTEEAPSSIPVTGNTPYLSHIKCNYHGDTQILRQSLHEQDEDVMIGDTYSVGFKVSGGVAYMMIDGIYRTNGSDFSNFDMGLVTTKPDYDIEIYCNAYDKLLIREYTLNYDADLSLIMSESEKPLVNSLKINGEVSLANLCFMLSALPSLQHLDLSGATFGWNGNTLPYEIDIPKDDITIDMIGQNVPGLISYILPKNLKGFDEFSLGHRSLEYLEIPASVAYYGHSSVSPYAGAKLDIVKVNNPVPVSFESGANILCDYSDYRKNTTLIVPPGSRDKYSAHPNWQGFREIIESDKPSGQRYVDIDGARYLLVHEFASLSGCYGSAPYAVVGLGIEVDGKRYPLRYVNSAAPLPSLVYYEASVPINFSGVDELVCPMLDLAPENIRLIDGYIHLYLYVPGAFDSADFASISPIEMWSYRINKAKGLLEIAPCLQDVEITEVKINGEPSEPEDGLYRFDPASPVDVNVSFTHRGQRSMATHYAPAYNAALEDSDLSPSGIYDMPIGLDVDVHIYNAQGLLVFTGKYSESDLREGVYIVVAKGRQYKLFVK